MLRLSFRVCAILLCALFSQDVRAQSTPPMSPIAPGQAHVFESEDFRIEIDTVALDIGPLAACGSEYYAENEGGEGDDVM